ncbi:uncharacterized protein LOC143891173 [Tasmannia lanceolata]|uniref:uncharacterized protein LOC143891173 n=1 Tax=Tasmannia lanceolata TaxID=3420 RepID=UPI0040631777
MAKDIILEIKCGKAEDSYRILPAYAHELVRSKYGSIICILRERELFRNGDDPFLRLFWAFGPSIRSFNRSLRPLVLLDVTLLRGKYHAILLVACGVDGDGGLFPISFAVVENENDDSWNWFLTHFRCNIMSSEGKVIMVYSDRQKGLIKAVPTVLPNSYHSFCMRHLSANFYDKFKDDMLYGYFWAATKALRKSHFGDEMDKIKARNERAHKYIIEHWPKEHWASCYFHGSRYDVQTTNRSECFNAILKDSRTLLIALLVEHIRWKISDFFHHRRKIDHQWKTKLTPNAETRLDFSHCKGHHHIARPIGQYLFEVLPCSHAMAAITKRKYDEYDFCQPWFLIEKYRDTYEEMVLPTLHRSQWQVPPHSLMIVSPPHPKRPPGRPRSRRTE